MTFFKVAEAASETAPAPRRAKPVATTAKAGERPVTNASEREEGWALF